MKTSSIAKTVVSAYLEAATFTDFGPEKGKCHSDSEFSRTAEFQAWETCADFLKQCEDAELLAQYEKTGKTWDSFGHDFWFTRNRHGAGFWDRGLGDLGNRLSDIARYLGSTDCYVGDDGAVYFS